MIRRRVLGALLLAVCLISGCATKPPEPSSTAASWGVSLASGNELALATLERVPDDASPLRDLTVLVDGRLHTFAAKPSFQDAHFSVKRNPDGGRAARPGDILQAPASGPTNIMILDGPKVVFAGMVSVLDRMPAAQPVPLSPANQATGAGRTPTFEWSPVSDPSGVTFRLVYGVDQDLSVPSMTTNVDALAEPRHQVPPDRPLLVGVTYYWRVQAIDGAGNEGPWSDEFSFTTGL